MITPILEARALAKLYPVKSAGRGARLHAVDTIDLVDRSGEMRRPRRGVRLR